MTPIPHPPRADLYRVHPSVEIPAALRGPSLERTAHHEAGHCILMQWAGLEPTHAVANAHQGSAHWTPWNPADEVIEPAEHDRPLAAAYLAAVYHAGIVAELLHAGLTWQGVLWRPHSRDWQCAASFLEPHFFGLAGHGFAQRTALAVLTSRWADVQLIAAELIERGTWRPEDGPA